MLKDMENYFDKRTDKSLKNIRENKVCKIIRMDHCKHINNDMAVGHPIKDVNLKIEILLSSTKN